ncbi:MAG: TolB-like 6-bladed beta-propeller domain-containing protein [Bacteroidales bacterium]|nr:TolB-like 6-bladed beta-propeller domain-containing protein [Bacteroidales bacterium]
MLRFVGEHFVRFTALLLLISCNTTPVDSKDFLFEVELQPELRFPLGEAFLPLDMYIHDDYLILRQSNTGNYRPDVFFAAYSLSDYSYKGSFGHKGRGPGEWTFPMYIHSPSNAPYLYLTDLSFRNNTAVIHKMVLDSTMRLREIGSFGIDKGGYYSMHSMAINKDSLLVYDEMFTSARLKVHHLGRDVPVISWEYGALKGDFNMPGYLEQIQYDENRGTLVANDSCVVFLYTFQDRIDVMDWNLKLKKRLNWQKTKPFIRKDFWDRMDNIWYYDRSFLGEHFLYALYYGVPYKELLISNYTAMEVFDLNGTPVCRYTFSRPMPAIFTVDERNFTLYGYRGDDGLEDSISVYRLPGLKEYLQNQ